MTRFFLWLVLAAVATGQQLTTRGPDPSSVTVGARSVVELSVEGARETMRLGAIPRVDGLDLVVSTPEIVTTAAGARTRLRVTITARRPGRFVVPRLVVELDGPVVTSGELQLEVVRDEVAERSAFTELVVTADEVWVGEPLDVAIRVGLERSFGARNLVQLFRRPLDVPVQIQAPWLRSPKGAVLRRPAAATAEAGGVTLALDAGPAVAERLEDEVRGDATFEVYELRRTIVPSVAGELELSGPLVRFAYATRFRDDLLSGRVPVERKEGHVVGESRTLVVRPLPEDGRPSGFAGAVGAFSASASAAIESVEVGQPFLWKVVLSGRGNFEQMEAPRFEDLAGFDRRGFTESRGTDRLEVTYELVPRRGGLREIPETGFDAFDPAAPGRYVRVSVGAVPLIVTGETAPTDEQVVRGDPGVDDLFGLKTPRPGSAAGGEISKSLIVAGLLLPWLLAAGVAFWKRGRDRILGDPEGTRARVAAASLSQRLASGSDAGGAFIEYLSARLRCSAAAVVTPDLAERLAEAGVDPETAGRAARILEEQVAASYGGGAAAGVEDVSELASRMEAVFAAEDDRP